MPLKIVLNIPLFSHFRHKTVIMVCIIVKELVDFMCHQKLEVHLNATVNFILEQMKVSGMFNVLGLLVLNHMLYH